MMVLEGRKLSIITKFFLGNNNGEEDELVATCVCKFEVRNFFVLPEKG